jgi:FixJ family two-component response regulator
MSTVAEVSTLSVFIVEDDAKIRALLREMLADEPWNVVEFERAEDFLATCRPGVNGCLLLDVRMPGLTGLDLQVELARRGIALPIIFISGYGDVPTTVQAMKGGAVNFLEKPFKRGQLLDALKEAVAQAERMQNDHRRHSSIQKRYETLTDREKQVFELVASGLTNKAIGLRFGISEKTIKVHRGRVMEKMNAGSLAELVLMAQQLGLCGPPGATIPPAAEDEE